MMSIGLIIALLAAYWVYSDARRLGYGNGGAIGWAAGTFLALIIFLPLYLIVGRRQRLPQKNQPAGADTIDVEATVVEETTKCGMCGGQVKEDFKVCPYCSYTLKPTCQSCGREVERSWQTCPHCQSPTAK